MPIASTQNVHTKAISLPPQLTWLLLHCAARAFAEGEIGRITSRLRHRSAADRGRRGPEDRRRIEIGGGEGGGIEGFDQMGACVELDEQAQAQAPCLLIDSCWMQHLHSLDACVFR